MNRPQYFYATPAGFKDVPYVRPVNLAQDPGGVISGQFVNDYIIQLDNDADQLFRSLFVEGVQQDQPANVQMRLRDSFGNFLTDGYIPLWLYAWGAGSTPPDGGSGRAKVFEPELYCPAGSVLIADFFDTGGGTTTLPSFSAPANMSTHTAVQMEGHAVGGQGQGAGVFAFGGALYQVLQFVGTPFPGGTGAVNVYKSVNGGLTWAILDGANGPTKNAIAPEPQSGVIFDGVHTITVAGTLGSVNQNVASAIYFQDFNLLTGTWGTAYGTAGSPTVYQINQLYRRSDGSLLVIAVDTLSGGAAHDLQAKVFLGGVWSSFSITSGLPGGWVANAMSSTVYDPATGTIHMFGIAFVGGVTKKQYYQQILIGNTIAGFQDLTALYSNATAMGDPVLLNGQIIWGCQDLLTTFSTLVVGSPLSAPVFAVAPAPGVDPAQPIPYGANPNSLQPTFATDGVNLWAVVVENRNGLGPGRVWLSVTQNIADPMLGWFGGVIYDDATAGVPLGGQFQYPTITLNGNSIYITFQNSPGQPTNFFMAATIAPSTPFPPYMELRGVKRFPEGCE